MLIIVYRIFRRYRIFLGFTRVARKKRAKVLLFFEIRKFLGKKVLKTYKKEHPHISGCPFLSLDNGLILARKRKSPQPLEGGVTSALGHQRSKLCHRSG